MTTLQANVSASLSALDELGTVSRYRIVAVIPDDIRLLRAWRSEYRRESDAAVASTARENADQRRVYSSYHRVIRDEDADPPRVQKEEHRPSGT